MFGSGTSERTKQSSDRKLQCRIKCLEQDNLHGAYGRGRQMDELHDLLVRQYNGVFQRMNLLLPYRFPVDTRLKSDRPLNFPHYAMR